MRVVEKITGTAGRYVLTGTVSRDERGRYIAHASTYLLTPGPLDRMLRSVATAQASGPDIEATGATAPEARTRLCLAAKEQLAATVTSFVWRPVVVLVASQWGRDRPAERNMTSRLAYTCRAMFVVTAQGASRLGHNAEVSAEHLSADLQGCIVQYA